MSAELRDLTPRQLSVAALVAQGKGDKHIADTLGMSTRRVQVHITAIAYLCGFDPECNTRIQLALWYRERVPITMETTLIPKITALWPPLGSIRCRTTR